MNTAVVQQRAWDGRAAANFMAGGAGSGLVVATACGAALAGTPRWPFVLAAVLVAVGLVSVWAEIGRPWRALNVVLHARSSWMTREALLAPALLLLALAAALLPAAAAAAAAPLAALSALAFVYCQGRMLRAARGIPTWREPAIVPLIVATALAEGAALWLIVISRPVGALVWLVFGALLLARQGLWLRWRARLRAAAPALRAVDDAGRLLRLGSLGALAVVVVLLLAPLPPIGAAPLQLAAALAALAGGLWFKFTLITRAAFTQGFTIPQRPVRGVRAQER